MKRASRSRREFDGDGLEGAVSELKHTFDALLAEIGGQINTQLASAEGFSRMRELLRSITGAGPQASALLTGLHSRIAFAAAHSQALWPLYRSIKAKGFT